MWGGRESITWKVTLDDDHVVEHELDVDVVVTDAFYRKRQNSRYT